MSAPAGGPWTRHGHDIPGVTVAGAGRPAAIARCGGPALCKQCAEDVKQAVGPEALPIAPDDVLAAHAVAKLRKHAEEHDDDEIEALLAEYDRRGAVAAEVRALRAELEDSQSELRGAYRVQEHVVAEIRRTTEQALGGARAQQTWPELLDALRAALVARTPQPADPADTAIVGDRLGPEWVDAQESVIFGGCRVLSPENRWICTRSAHPGRQHVATIDGKVVDVWSSAPLPAVPDGPGEHAAAEASGVLWMAMRYALGRATYAVQEVGSAIAQHAHRLEPWQRERMAQEIERELGYDSDGAAWGSDAATWRQAISDLRAPLPAVPDGEEALEPDAADPDDVRQALRAALRGRDEAADEVEQLRDQLDRAHALNRKQHRELVELTMVPPPPFGEDVPARLDAAAEALRAHNASSAAEHFRDLALRMRGRSYYADTPDELVAMRAAVAAALARPTEQQG